MGAIFWEVILIFMSSTLGALATEKLKIKRPAAIWLTSAACCLLAVLCISMIKAG